jgi:hypothetical protein
MSQKIFFIVLMVIVFSNILPLDKMFSNGSFYRYSNNDGSVTFAEFKTRDFEMMNRRFESHKTMTKNDNDTIYRLFKKNPFAFWRWGQYFFDKRYKLTYKDWSEIKAVRGNELENKTGFQDF